ncbi:MAG TPA: DUF1223 domain-containing protein [Verrucomicrobiota bacterium]|nr:DUF1223 domain-containing protein [Verrucomicrobiota bacterium]HRZ36317.1 DUF1223 domain-containing protein [Candidatus Paceibacterota bacterium]HRZ55610.1 DUF1223 domain-containing protein [Candidatus Paceibacterota bacterium]
MRQRISLSVLAAAVSLAFGPPAAIPDEMAPPAMERFVLVELFTSQGCNLCPDAERLLGALADRNRRVVPIAFHVDYFNTPWRDPYSHPLCSERQREYDFVYPKPKPLEYGLYYTPMLMVDGAQSVNGRDRPGAEAAIRQALLRNPTVALRASLRIQQTPAIGELEVRVAPISPLVLGRPLRIGTVLRDDGLTNRVLSGENANKTLVARFPARKILLGDVTLDGPAEKALQFAVPLNPTWTTNRLRVAVFAQDRQSGVVHQALDLAWPSQSHRGPASDRATKAMKPIPIP